MVNSWQPMTQATTTPNTETAAAGKAGGARRPHGVTKVVVNDFAGHSFQLELTTALAAGGYDVTHCYCATNVTPHAAFDGPAAQAPRVTVQPIRTSSTFEKYRIGRRVLHELQYGMRSAGAHRHAEVVLSANMPLLSLAVVHASARRRGARHVVWLQDLQAGLVANVRGRGSAGVVARTLHFLERELLRRADHIVAISDTFATDVEAMGVASERIEVIENWSPISELPVTPKQNAWAERHGLADTFNFVYCGTLGTKHSPELLVALAEAMRHDGSASVVVVSEGSGARWLASERERLGLTNLVTLPYQAFEDLPMVLGSADVLLGLLEPGAGTYSVPSKVLSYLCAGRAILAAIPAENAAAQLIAHRAHAGVVTTHDPADFVAAATRLRANDLERARLGAAGRTYAEAAFDIGAIVARFEAVLRPRPEHTSRSTPTLTAKG